MTTWRSKTVSIIIHKRVASSACLPPVTDVCVVHLPGGREAKRAREK
jgi:hypothetical protein